MYKILLAFSQTNIVQFDIIHLKKPNKKIVSRLKETEAKKGYITDKELE